MDEPPTEDTVAREAVVHGLVQGVFYRATCRREADKHGVAGWARNQPDGTVRIRLEGPPEAVDAMLDWARRGPEQAVVDRVDVTEHDPTGLTDFDVT